MSSKSWIPSRSFSKLAARLADQVALQGTMAVTTELLDVEGIALTWPSSRSPYEYLAPTNCWSQDKHVEAMRTVAAGDLKGRKRDLALDVVMEIFSGFNWPDAPRDKFEALQSDRFASID